MKTRHQLKRVVLGVSMAMAASSTFATNGYFPHGVGMRAKGMGGAGVALAQDAFAGANNPAAAAFAGNRWEIGLDIFSPDRSASRSGGLAGESTSSAKYFPVPELGYNTAISNRLGVGIAVYGNGGMNTTYKGSPIDCGAGAANLLCGSGNLGVNLMQLTIAPTVGYKLSDSTSIGVSPLLVHQRFQAKGLQAFAAFNGGLSADDANLTNRGNDSSNGFGVRVGLLSHLNDTVSIGAAYTPKVNMSKFDKYAGLFAEQGDFDIPAHWTVGVSFRPAKTSVVSIDYSRIQYSGVASVANPSSNQALLGADSGPGFGWRSIGVIKLGYQFQWSERATIRVGYNKGDNPIRPADVTFNILAPGVMTSHYTLGGTYTLSDKSDWTWALMYAPEVTVSGSSLFGPLLGAGNGFADETIRMKQYSFGVNYSKRF